MNVVLTLASTYAYPKLQPLVESLAKTNFKGKMVMFCNQLSADTMAKLKAQKVELVPYVAEYPYFTENKELVPFLPENPGQFLSPNSLRYFLYLAYIRAHAAEIDWVLHTDSRDVIFQLDPFAYYQEKKLYCFLEDLSFSIKDNKYNAFWIQHGFGEQVFSQMANTPISCSGVTLGDAQSFRSYCELLTSYLKTIPNVGGMDQGVHNYLLYTKQLPFAEVVKDDDGPVTTLTTFKPYAKIKFDGQKRIINNKNQVTNIVHQYDRHMPLLWRYNRAEYWERKVNKLKRKILVLMGRKFND